MALLEKEYQELVRSLIPSVQRAGAAVLKIYQSNPHVRFKADRSPVTDADQAAEEILVEALSKLLPEVPVVGEELVAGDRVPEFGDEYFLVDPLDGTKEFLKRNDEFTINIALINNEIPVLGLVYAPAKCDCYLTLTPRQAVRCQLSPSAVASVQDLEFQPLAGEASTGRPLTAIVSRSHLNTDTLQFLSRLGNPPRIVMGSSLKFGVLARGDADVYPRFGATSGWDTAAGHAVLNASGGCVLTLAGKPLKYRNREGDFRNPPFIAWRSAAEAQQHAEAMRP